MPEREDASRLTRLRGVIAVGTTRTVGGVAVTLLSVEVYAHGWRVLVQVVGRGDLGVVNLPFLVADDAGTVYRTWPAQGHAGWGDGYSRFWYAAVVCEPAPPPEARTLILDLPELRRRVFAVVSEADNGWGPASPLPPPELDEVVVPGPWRFTVALPGRTEGSGEGGGDG